MNGESWHSPRILLLAVLLMSGILNTYHIWWGLPLQPPVAWEVGEAVARTPPRGYEDPDPEVVTWGADAIAPMGPLVYAKQTFLDGFWVHKYPPFHFMVLSAVFAPFMAYLFLSGQLAFAGASDDWPYGLSDPVMALSVLTLLARLVTAAMGTAIVGLIYLIAQRLFGRLAGIFAALIVALSFPFIFYSHTSNLDIPYLFWFTLGLFFYVKLFEESRTRDYALLGICMALAVATKDQAYGLLPLMPIALLWFRIREQRSDRHTARVRPLFFSLPWGQFGLACVAFVGTFGLAANIVNNWAGYLQHLEFITVGPGAVPEMFERTVSGYIALFLRVVSDVVWSLNTPLFVVCTAGLLWGLIRFRNVTLALLAPVLSYYFFFFMATLYVLPRYVLPVVVVVAVFGGLVLRELWNATGRLSWMVRPAVVALFLYSFLYGASVDWLLQRDPRYQAEEWIEHHVAPTAVIEAYAQPQYLPRFKENRRVRLIFLQGDVEDDFRRRKPEYVFITWAYYRRITEDREDDFDQEEFYQQLWNGELGYRVAADFKAPEPIARNLIPGLNSRVTIFERERQE